MEKKKIIESVAKTSEYLTKRKDFLVDELQTVQQRLDELRDEIVEKEAYVELESNRELLENNMFNVYNSAEKHTKEKEYLMELLEKCREEKKTLEERLELVRQELNEVCQHLVRGAEVDRYLKESRDISFIKNRVQLCMDLLEVDRERCMTELRVVLDELSKE